MRRAEALEFFASHRSDLRRLSIISLLIVGSVARDEARPDSDLDLIAEFDPPVGYLALPASSASSSNSSAVASTRRRPA